MKMDFKFKYGIIYHHITLLYCYDNLLSILFLVIMHRVRVFIYFHMVVK